GPGAGPAQQRRGIRRQQTQGAHKQGHRSPAGALQGGVVAECATWHDLPRDRVPPGRLRAHGQALYRQGLCQASRGACGARRRRQLNHQRPTASASKPIMKRSRNDIAPSISEQAADWLVRLSESAVSEPHRRQFMKWLKKSPQNVEEFIAIATLHQEVGEQKSSLAEIIAEVGCRGQKPAVPLFGDPSSPGGLPARAKAPRRYYPLWATAAGLALLAVLLLQWFPGDPPLVSHRTQLGEQRSVVLADGSIITLNTLSEATVRFDHSAR